MTPQLLKTIITFAVLAGLVPRQGGLDPLLAGYGGVILLVAAAVIVMFGIPIDRLVAHAYRARRDRRRRRRPGC